MDVSSEFILLDGYHSDLDISVSEEILPTFKTRQSRTCQTVNVYENRNQAKDWLKQNQIWSFVKAYDTEAGRKEMYRCNIVKTRGPQCGKVVQFQYNNHNQGVIHFESTSSHTHDEIKKSQTKVGINQVTKDAIKNQVELGIKKPKTISQNLANEHLINPEIEVPNDRQLTNFLQTLKGPNHKTLTFGQLLSLLQTHASISDDDDKPFILYQLKIDEYDKQESFPENEFDIPIGEKSSRFFITTRRLLSIAALSKFIHADSTYKLIWNNFPVLICGTSDQDKVFHPFGISVCTNEKDNDFQFMFESLKVGLQAINQTALPNDGSISLIADSADAITNGFKAVFSPDTDFKRRMCWFHMKKSVDNYLSILGEKDLQCAVLKDINVLQLATTEQQFCVASRLFFQKYSSNSNSNMKKFLEYFNKEWLVKHVGWYEGYLKDSPSTNNGLESINSTLKKEATFRVRMPMAEFLTTANDVVNKWSEKRDPYSVNHPKVFMQEPSITTSDFTAAYNWMTKSFVIQKNCQDTKQFFIKSKHSTQVFNNTSVKAYCDATKSSSFRSFDEYHSICFSVWHVVFEGNSDETNWKMAQCSCPSNQKNYICKHIIGIAARLNFVTIPLLAKLVPIDEKRRRGRPALARKALQLQPDLATAQSPAPASWMPLALAPAHSSATASWEQVTQTPEHALMKRPAPLESSVFSVKRTRGRPPKTLSKQIVT